ncbi:MAG: S-methyl-5-thioribose-1-phosphate isomerase, partial [Spirochaetia bacterium]
MPHVNDTSRVKSIEWTDGELLLLDQTQLPVEVVVEKQETIEQVWDSIKQLKVRGAPAIGVTGAYGLVVGMRGDTGLDREKFLERLQERADYLDSARPTAVNLSWALKRVVAKAKESAATTGTELLEVVRAEAEEIHREDEQLCKHIGENGVDLIKPGFGVLTHCNAGRLATSEYGTATAPMYLAHERGAEFRVYSDESRPLLQGSRLTSWELQ